MGVVDGFQDVGSAWREAEADEPGRRGDALVDTGTWDVDRAP